jgi:hypothetical protein
MPIFWNHAPPPLVKALKHQDRKATNAQHYILTFSIFGTFKISAKTRCVKVKVKWLLLGRKINLI